MPYIPRSCRKQCIYFWANVRRRQTQTILYLLSFEVEIAIDKFGHVIVLLISPFLCVFFFFCHKLIVPHITTTILFLKNDPTTSAPTRFGVSDVTISHGSQLSKIVQKHRFPWRISQIFWIYPRGYPRPSCFRLFDGSIRNISCRFTN